MNGTERRRLTTAPGADEEPAWSPDGRRIVFSSERDGNAELYIMNADGSNERRATRTESAEEYGPAWSPDGKQIVFWRGGTGPDTIVVMDADGTDSRALSRPDEAGIHPAWSPNGKRIAYMRGTDLPVTLQHEVWVMDADGGAPHRLVTGPFTEPAELDWARASD